MGSHSLDLGDHMRVDVIERTEAGLGRQPGLFLEPLTQLIGIEARIPQSDDP